MVGKINLIISSGVKGYISKEIETSFNWSISLQIFDQKGFLHSAVIKLKFKKNGESFYDISTLFFCYQVNLNF